jgi:hypothetical protein
MKLTQINKPYESLWKKYPADKFRELIKELQKESINNQVIFDSGIEALKDFESEEEKL